MRRELRAIEKILTADKKKAVAAARELVKSPKGLALLCAAGQAAGVAVRLDRDGRCVARAVLLQGALGAQLTGVLPGKHVLAISTGRILWERELLARDVLSAAAVPDEALRAAAQTGAFEQEPTLVELVAGGALTLKIFAGRESGTMQLVLNDKQ